MNFIAHFHFYRNDDPHYNLGLILPDLVKTFCKTHLKPGEKFINRALQGLNEGSKMHLLSDKKFHNSQTFSHCLDFVSDTLDSDAKWPRKWFLNHLLTEIMLDRVIMDKHPEICDEFYGELKKANRSKTELYLKMCNIPNYTNFSEGLTRFIDFPFLQEYRHNEKIIFALNRVYSRLGIAYEWTEEDKNLLLKNMDDMLKYIDFEYINFKKELNF